MSSKNYEFLIKEPKSGEVIEITVYAVSGIQEGLEQLNDLYQIRDYISVQEVEY